MRLRIFHCIHGPIQANVVDRLKKFYSQTFWGNEHVFRCCQAAQALAKRGENVVRLFIGLSKVKGRCQPIPVFCSSANDVLSNFGFFGRWVGGCGIGLFQLAAARPQLVQSDPGLVQSPAGMVGLSTDSRGFGV